jgi:hypothetical protein
MQRGQRGADRLALVEVGVKQAAKLADRDVLERSGQGVSP